MCIRDSSYVVDLRINVSFVVKLRVVWVTKQPPRVIRPHQACLLYTSDAADERSSVDLGGRRIIKKKKKENEQRETDNQETKNKQNA